MNDPVVTSEATLQRPFTLLWAEKVPANEDALSKFSFSDSAMGLQSEESMVNAPEEGTNYSTDQTTGV